MAANRQALYDGGLARISRQGDNPMTSRSLLSIATDAARTLSVADIAGGLIQFTGFTAGRVLTTDTAANIIAANPWMDLADSFEVVVSITTAFAGTLAAGAGVTLAGRATVPASTMAILIFTKTSATTVTCTVL